MSNKHVKQELFNIAKKYNLEDSIPYLDNFFVEHYNEDSNNIIGDFYNLFSNLSDKFLYELSIASKYYFSSVLIVDKILDEKICFNNSLLLFAIALRENSLHRMYNLFPANSKYWEYFFLYYEQYVKANSRELKYHKNKLTDISQSYLEIMYSGNSALAKAVPVAMAFKGDKVDIVGEIEQSIDYYYIGLNLLDDVKDWKKDWKYKQFSFLITKTIIHNNLDISLLTTEHLGKHIFFNGEAIKCLDLSLSYLNKASKIAEYIGSEDWKKTILANIEECNNLRVDISMLVDRQLSIIGVNNNIINNSFSNSIQKFNYNQIKPVNVIEKKLLIILEHWTNGFIDTKLISFFPNLKDFIFRKRYYEADIFQRAVICDIIIDLKNRINIPVNRYLYLEFKYFLDKQRNLGGWNFYNDLEYQPNDTDTSSQVIQVFIKLNRTHLISKATYKQVSEILDKQLIDEGNVKTWFLPAYDKHNRTERKQYEFLKYYTKHNLDTSIDIEVIANFLYTLILLDKNKYAKYIDLGVKFIERAQNKYGYWLSTWYYGRYYGTYMCLKVLKEIQFDKEISDRAFNFLLIKRNTKGWGETITSQDPLSTAFALISLYYLKQLGYKIPNNRIFEAIEYLNYAILNIKEIKKSKYINLRRDKFSTFNSKSIILAYATKALSFWL